jgi:hypothetical protein
MDQITSHRLVCFQRLGRALLSLLSCPARGRVGRASPEKPIAVYPTDCGADTGICRPGRSAPLKLSPATACYRVERR